MAQGMQQGSAAQPSDQNRPPTATETGQYACMSKETDEFRKQAEDCRKFAALKLNDRAFWLELAEDWMKLAQEGDLAKRH
jgi:hypothetical protein